MVSNEPVDAAGTGLQIPGILVEFLERRGSVACASTRDRNLVPHIHWISGWELSPDRREISCLVARGFAADLLESVEENRQLALTVEWIGPHETYQFKGDYAGWRAVEPGDRAVFERCRDAFARTASKFHGRPSEEELLRAYIPEPELVVRLRVREIFQQTPGPGAGRRLAPAEA